jgi:hypothetical protein
MSKYESLILSAMTQADLLQRITDLACGLKWMTFRPYIDEQQKGAPNLTLVKTPPDGTSVRIIVAEVQDDHVRLNKIPRRHWLGACPGVETYFWRPRDMRQIEKILGLHTYAAAALFGDAPVFDSDILATDNAIAKAFDHIGLGRTA